MERKNENHFFVVTIIVISGCAPTGNVAHDNRFSQSQAHEMYDESGQKMWFIQCNGALNSAGSCFQRASTICPEGYYLVSKEQTSGGSYGTASAQVNNANYSANAIVTEGVNRHMQIKCKS